MAHVFDLSAERRRILMNDLVLMMSQAERLESQPHSPRVTDAAAHLLDANFALGEGLFRRLLRPASSPPDVCSRHGPLPPLTWRASDNRCSTPRDHAHARS